MKTKEELNTIKNEFDALNAKLAELTAEELAQVSGGGDPKHPRPMPVMEVTLGADSEYPSPHIEE